MGVGQSAETLRWTLVTVGDLVLDLQLEARLPVAADAHQMSPSLLLEPGGACTTLLTARNLGLAGDRAGHGRRRLSGADAA